MPATRPPRSAVRAAVRAALADLAPGERILVAFSGGPDSLALLAATVVVAAERGLVCGAVIVDHGLQPGSVSVAGRAADQARLLGCADVEVVGVQVAAGPGAGGPEAAARAVRYAALDRAATGVMSSQRSPEGSSDDMVGQRPPAAAVLLGHTRDDQAETVLLGLARGSGTRSLAGMSPRMGLYRRPLLALPRAVVLAAAVESAGEDDRLRPWTDPHNADPAFARVRVRTEVLPVLERELGPGIVDALARTADLARQDADALDAWADEVWSGIAPAAPVAATPGVPAATHPAAPAATSDPGAAPTPVSRSGTRSTAARPADAAPGELVARIDLAQLSHAGGQAPALPAAIRTRLVRRYLLAAGCPTGALTAQHVRGVAALLDAPGTRAEIALPGGLRARREGGALVVRA